MNNVLRHRVSLLGTLNIVDSSLSNDCDALSWHKNGPVGLSTNVPAPRTSVERGQTGSNRRMVKPTQMTRSGPFRSRHQLDLRLAESHLFAATDRGWSGKSCEWRAMAILSLNHSFIGPIRRDRPACLPSHHLVAEPGCR
jgi:hypothetical protein